MQFQRISYVCTLRSLRSVKAILERAFHFRLQFGTPDGKIDISYFITFRVKHLVTTPKRFWVAKHEMPIAMRYLMKKRHDQDDHRNTQASTCFLDVLEQ